MTAKREPLVVKMKFQFRVLSIALFIIKSLGVLLNCDPFLMNFLPHNCLVKKTPIPKGETIQFSNINKSSLLLLDFQSCWFAFMPLNIFIDNPQLRVLKVTKNVLRNVQIKDF